MTILKFLTLFLVLYVSANISWWGWQEVINYEDTQTARSLNNTINISYSVIQEKGQDLDELKIDLNQEKSTLDELFSSKKIAQYNELVPKYNKSIDRFNVKKDEYDQLIETHNMYVRQMNELINKSSVRTFLFPIPPYKKPLVEELK